VEGKRDEELMAEYLAGDSGAFDCLVRRYVDDLYGFFSRFVGNRTAAEDLVQDTFLQVHLSAGSFDLNRTFKPWLYTIAANKGRDYLRARGRRPMQSLDLGQDEGHAPSPAKLLEADDAAAADRATREEQRRRVQETIARMPEHLQFILVLGYYQRLPYAEIAQILDIPVGTVKSRLHSAVQHFAHLWREQNQQSDA